MLKKGQAGQVIKILIAAVFIAIIFYFGYKLTSDLLGRTCKTEMARFQTDLRHLDEKVKYGSIMEFTKQVPCNAEEIYFFDLDKNPNTEFIREIPILSDSIESDVKKNIFIMKNDKIIDSFYAGDLNIKHPHYICFLPKFGNINYFLEGKGTLVGVYPGCLQPECTYFPVKVDNPNQIIKDAFDFGQTEPSKCPNCPDNVAEEEGNYGDTKNNVKIFRQFKECKDDTTTIVEIIIKPVGDAKLKIFRYYESIPVECVDEVIIELEDYLKEKYNEKVSISPNSLIIWSFNEIKEERLSYVLNQILSEECKEAIEGMGIAETIE